jgi:type IV secretory pathway TraG/TraD family ATPase VirD4
MAPDRQIVMRAGMQPMVTGRLGWFADPMFRDLRLPPPEIPVLAWDVPDDDGSTRVLRPKPRNLAGLSKEDFS